MKNNNGYIGIIVLIISALIVGIVATYWYVQRGLPDAPAPLSITIKDVPSPTGPAGTYIPLVQPEPSIIDPDYQIYAQNPFTFQYPRTWETSPEPDGVTITDTNNASSTITITDRGVSFPEDFKSCLTSTSVTVQGVDTSISFLCDTSKSSKNKNRVWVVADTQSGFAFFGSVSKEVKEDENRAKYMEIFTHVFSSFEVKK